MYASVSQTLLPCSNLSSIKNTTLILNVIHEYVWEILLYEPK